MTLEIQNVQNTRAPQSNTRQTFWPCCDGFVLDQMTHQLATQLLKQSLLLLTGALLAPEIWAQSVPSPTLQLQVGHSQISNVGFSVSPTGDLVASTDGQGIIKLWETEQGRLVCTLDPGTQESARTLTGRTRLAWSADGSQLLSPDTTGGFFRWNLRRCGDRTRLDPDGKPIVNVEDTAPEEQTNYRDRPPNVLAVATLPDSRVLVQTNQGFKELRPFGTSQTWSDSGAAPPTVAGSPPTAKGSHANSDTILSASEDGRYVLMGNIYGPNGLLDRATNKLTAIKDYQGLDSFISGNKIRRQPVVYPEQRCYALSRSGRWLVLKSATDNTLRVYDMKGGHLVSTVAMDFGDPIPLPGIRADDKAQFLDPEKMRAGVAGLAFSDDERRVYVFRDDFASISRKPVIEVRDMKTLALLNSTEIGGLYIDNNASVTLLPTRSKGKDRLLISVYSWLGPELLSVTMTKNKPVFDNWSMDAPAHIGSLFYGTAAWYAQTVDASPRKNEPRLINPTPKEVPQLLARRNQWFSTYLSAWSIDRAAASREAEVATSHDRMNISAFSADGRYYAVQTTRVTGNTEPPMMASLSLWDIRASKRLWTRDTEPTGRFGIGIAVSPAGDKAALWSNNQVGGKQELKLFDGVSGDLIAALPVDFKYGSTEPRLTFASDGKTLYFTDDYHETGAIDLADARNPRLLWSRDSSRRHPFGFLPRSGRLMMPRLPDGVSVKESDYAASLFDGWPNVLRLPVAQDEGVAVANSGESILAVTQRDRIIRLFDISQASPQAAGELVGISATITAMGIAPDGRRLLAGDDQGGLWLFDIARKQLLARMYSFRDGSWVVIDGQGRFDTNDVEAMRRLHWVMPDEPFRAYPLELLMRDYFEPHLLPRLLAGAPLPPVPNVASINRARPQVLIAAIRPSPSMPGRVDVTVSVRPTNYAGRSSSAADLRLFRAGQLVGTASLDTPAQTAALKRGQDITVEFTGIRLPTTTDAIDFSAYAFNTDHVKSATVTSAYTPTKSDPSPRRRAYIVSIGINAHDRSEWNLTFAANDAHRTQEVLVERLRLTGAYAEVVGIPLISDQQSANARKNTLHAALAALAGRPYERELLADVPNAAKLDTVTPDDIVIITFAGHGFSDGGEFYLVPQDIGTGKQIDATTRHRSISTLDLAAWLKDIDAGDLTLVIDACQSAALVEADGFKPGPMGAKGLGQLAYDKGMRILTATQADDVALESGRLQQGLLTFALVNEGLAQAKADFRPVDQKIDLAEWLAFGTQRVPEIYLDVRSGRRTIESGTAVWIFGARAASRATAAAVKVQRPTLFDFRRQRRSPLVSIVTDSP